MSKVTDPVIQAGLDIAADQQTILALLVKGTRMMACYMCGHIQERQPDQKFHGTVDHGVHYICPVCGRWAINENENSESVSMFDTYCSWSAWTEPTKREILGKAFPSWFPYEKEMTERLTPIEIAAQCWCDPRVENRQMDPELATMFAEQIQKFQAENAKLRVEVAKLTTVTEVAGAMLEQLKAENGRLTN